MWCLLTGPNGRLNCFLFLAGVAKLPRSAHYLAQKWKLPTIVTPIRTAEESALFLQLLEHPSVWTSNGCLSFTHLTAMFNARVIMMLANAPPEGLALKVFLKTERYLSSYFDKRLSRSLAVSKRLAPIRPELRRVQRLPDILFRHFELGQHGNDRNRNRRGDCKQHPVRS